jgi:hypothetical protein
MVPFERTDAVKRRENIVAAIILAGAVPLLIDSALYNSTLAWLALKVYLATATVFGYILFVRERDARREGWLWRAMLRVVLAHAVVMVIFLYINVRWIEVPVSPLVSFAILLAVVILELCYFLAIIDRFRPSLPPNPSAGEISRKRAS